MNQTNIGDALFCFQIISNYTLAEALSLKLPINYVSLKVYLQLNSAYNAFGRRFTDLAPFCRLLSLVSACIMHFTIGEVEP